MSAIRSRFTRAGVAAVAAAVLFGAAGTALAQPAFATTSPAPTQLDPAVPTIDGTEISTLTIHKLLQTDANGTTPGNGKEDATVQGTPIADVTFSIQRLNLDLTTQAGWEALAALNGSVPAAQGLIDPAFAEQTKVTDAAGLAQFANMPVGAYILTETKTPAGVTPAEPFIVTLPMTDPVDTNVWMTDVHVYPKNAKSGIDKTVSDAKAPTVGDTLTYTLTADIPRIDVSGGATLANYQIVDPLDARLSSGTDKVTVTMVGTGAIDLDPAMYTIDAVVAADNKTYVTVSFTEAGRAAIAAARAAGDTTTKVQVVIDAVVKTVDTTGNGVIENKGYLIPNTPTTAWDPKNPDPNNPPDGTETPTVESKYGKVLVTKTGTDKKAASTYNGAEFQVYQCSVAGNTASGTATLVDADPAVDGVQPLTVNGATTFVTGTNGAADGTTSIDGLRNNDWIDGVAHTPTEADWYCLVETKAPAGYELQTKPIPFQVLQTNLSPAFELGVTVVDVPSNGGFKLPVTGAAGVIVLVAAGSFLVVGAGVTALAANRRRKA